LFPFPIIIQTVFPDMAIIVAGPAADQIGAGFSNMAHAETLTAFPNLKSHIID
jgi:hypothetical protein